MEKAILIGYQVGTDEEYHTSSVEMVSLCLAAEIEVVEEFSQKGRGPFHSTYFGSGKLLELKERKEKLGINLIVVKENLNATQVKELEDILDCGVLDRTSLILEIFGQRAKSKEARIQVEIARLEYALPRLIGSYSNLGRQGGSSGARNRGLGEKKITLDKRRIQREIHALKKELALVEKHRQTQSENRQKSSVKKVALVGYTNAGKSSLMNALLKLTPQGNAKEVYVQDQLFATLETSTRLIHVKSTSPFLLSDTVGFVSSLPPLLVKAFRSTLKEAKEADLLLHVVNLADPAYLSHQGITEDTLKEIEASEIQRINVYTHADLLEGELHPENGVVISSVTGFGLDQLIKEIQGCLYGKITEERLFIPYAKSVQIKTINENLEILSLKEKEEGIEVLVKGNQTELQNLKKK